MGSTIKKRSRFSLFFYRLKLRFSGPFWIRLWAPKRYKRWELVLSRIYIYSGFTNSPSPMFAVTEEQISDTMKIHPGHVISALHWLEGRGFIERIVRDLGPGKVPEVRFMVSIEGKTAVTDHTIIREGYDLQSKVLKDMQWIYIIIVAAIVTWSPLARPYLSKALQVVRQWLQPNTGSLPVNSIEGLNTSAPSAIDLQTAQGVVEVICGICDSVPEADTANKVVK